MFLNGVQEGSTASDSNNYIAPYCTVGNIANAPSNTSYARAAFQDLRITVGVARYTTTFTPPTAPFPDW